MKRIIACLGIAVLPAAALSLTAAWGGDDLDNSRGIEVTRSEYGDNWPFTVESGTLHCTAYSKVLIRADGVDYAVNGLVAGDPRFRNVRPIWAIWRDNPNPDAEGPKVNIGPITQRGLSLCES